MVIRPLGWHYYSHFLTFKGCYLILLFTVHLIDFLRISSSLIPFVDKKCFDAFCWVLPSYSGSIHFLLHCWSNSFLILVSKEVTLKYFHAFQVFLIKAIFDCFDDVISKVLFLVSFEFVFSLCFLSYIFFVTPLKKVRKLLFWCGINIHFL